MAQTAGPAAKPATVPANQPPPQAAPAAQASTDDLLRKLHCMEERIKGLEALQPKLAAAAGASPVAPEPPLGAGAPGPAADDAWLAQVGPGKPGGTAGTGTDVAQGVPASQPATTGAASQPGSVTTGPLPPAKSDAKTPAAPNKTGTAATGVAAKPGTAPEATVAKVDPCAMATAGNKDLFALQPGAAPAAANKDLFALNPPAAGAAPSAGGPPGVAPATGDKAIFGLADSPVDGLKLGAYGEMKYGAKQNPAANGQWQNGADAHRLVLLPTYAITKNIIFNAEIEFEHGGSGFDPDDKLHGTAEIEQMFIDFKITDEFNFRSPGIDLVPLGYTNLHHEPTLFYSVNRPELANGLIPTTFKVPATGFYGKLADGLNYQFQVSASIEDFGDDFAKRTDANTVPAFPAGYAGGVSGLNALGSGVPPRGDFRQLNNTLAYALQLTYAPTFLPGFAGTTGVYYSPNITPRGAYAGGTDANGNPFGTGALLGRTSLTIIDTEFRYRIPEHGWELRGEFVGISFGNSANLRANNDGDPTNNVGKTMYGVSGEIAYHHQLGKILDSDWEAVPFYRYSYVDLQTKGYAGSDDNTPKGAGKVQYHTVGIAVFPSPKLVMKFNFQRVIDKEFAGARSDSILGGVGFFF